MPERVFLMMSEHLEEEAEALLGEFPEAGLELCGCCSYGHKDIARMIKGAGPDIIVLTADDDVGMGIALMLASLVHRFCEEGFSGKIYPCTLNDQVNSGLGDFFSCEKPMKGKQADPDFQGFLDRHMTNPSREAHLMPIYCIVFEVLQSGKLH